MTPAARYAAAADVLDRIVAGAAAEKALSNWARASRYAGSKDRAAVRGHVFDALRRRSSAAWMAGGTEESGRALILGGLRLDGIDPHTVFTGGPYALQPLLDAEAAAPEPLSAAPVAIRWNLPDWLASRFAADLGDTAEATALALSKRADIHLRANLKVIGRARLAARLLDEGIATRPHELANTALVVEGHPRGLTGLASFAEGLFELQDAASQAVAAAIPVAARQRVLDYCAGGGGKVLAVAAREPEAVCVAHDAEPARMVDLPVRAARAGARIEVVQTPEGLQSAAPFDVVICDVPCSGSGAWRRSPMGKWTLTPERLAELNRVQAEILQEAARYLRPGGTLAYATCSVLRAENEELVARMLPATGLSLRHEQRFSPLAGADGFYLALLG